MTSLAIKIVEGPGAGQAVRLRGAVFIGSGPQCQLQISGPGIASIHARIDRRGHACNLVDLTNVSMVRVNDRLIKSRKLLAGDVVTIGDVALEVVELRAAAPVPSAPRVMESAVPMDREPSPPDEEMEAVEEAEEVVEEVAEPPPRRPVQAVKRRPVHYRPEDAFRGQQAAPVRALRIVVMAIVAIIIVVCGIVFWRFKKDRERFADMSYMAAMEFARAHPNDVDQIIAVYRRAQQECAFRPQLKKFFTDEIERLSAQKNRDYSTEVLRESVREGAGGQPPVVPGQPRGR